MLEQEIETLLRTAIAEETADGSPLLAAQCYADAVTLLLRQARAVGTNDGFFVSVRALLAPYIERARLLADVAVDEEKSLAAAALPPTK